MNFCFISNFSKTQLFSSVANQLFAKGHSISWIATNRKIYQQLINDYGKENVLLINRANIQMDQDTLGEFKINELVHGDRVLRHHPEKGQQFLTNIQKPIFDFLKAHKSEYILGEVTWAHELLIHRMCNSNLLNCTFLNPHVIRIPNNKFAFFTDEYQSKILESSINLPKNTTIITPKAPSYLKINRKILSGNQSIFGRLHRIKRFITNENIDLLDPTLLVNFKKRIVAACLEEWRRVQYKRLETAKVKPSTLGNYVFLGLHKQPEASVDVIGRYYEDQYQNIVNLWRTLPKGWKLVVKEHSIAIGDRPMAFYKKIKSLPKVVLVDENISSYALIKSARIVATISGTIAYEAALMNIPSITFAPTFFNNLNKCKRISINDLNRFTMQEIVENLEKRPDNRLKFSNHLLNNSFEGNVLDPISDPNSLAPQNINAICTALLQCTLEKEASV